MNRFVIFACYLEALINIVSALYNVLSSELAWSAILQTDQAQIEINSLCNLLWSAMLVTQSVSLIVTAWSRSPQALGAVYWGMLIGEVLITPIMIYWLDFNKTTSHSFVAALILFGVWRIVALRYSR